MIIANSAFCQKLPYEYKILRDAREQRIEKLNKRYVEELEKLKIKFTKQGDLENALLIDREIKRYSTTKTKTYVSDVKGFAGHSSRTRNNVYEFDVEGIGGDAFLTFWASYDLKGSTFGDVYLVNEEGDKKKVHSWKSSDFKTAVSTVRSYEKLKPISVNVKNFINSAGKYKVEFVYSKGERGLTILKVSLDIHN